jgi:predicted ABC-type ATPase
VPPEFYIVAGAPGTGKSRAFPVSEFGIDFFNADDRAAELNGGSYHNISLELRKRVNRDFEAFIKSHIEESKSLAIETTLRSAITFDQIGEARRKGFAVTMLYLGTEDPELNLDRIAVRWDLGYHAAPREVLMEIHLQSLAHLRIACQKAFLGFMRLVLYDNTPFDQAPVPACEVTRGSVKELMQPLPRWAERVLRETNFRYPPQSSWEGE